MEASALYIAFPRIKAAIQAGQLDFLVEHWESLTLTTQAETCRIAAEQGHTQLGELPVRWIERFAREARPRELDDYRLIWEAFHRFPIAPGVCEGQLVTLCAARGIDQ